MIERRRGTVVLQNPEQTVDGPYPDQPNLTVFDYVAHTVPRLYREGSPNDFG